MTIVVMFGKPEKFGATEWPKYFEGNNGDQFLLVADRDYAKEEAVLALPEAQGNTPLPTIYHQSSSFEMHTSQKEWLDRIPGYKSYKSGSFSHIDKTEPLETIKSWYINTPSHNEVSNFVSKHSKIVLLGLLDELAAWNLLVLGGDVDANGVCERLLVSVDSFAPELRLGEICPEKLLPELEKQAKLYC